MADHRSRYDVVHVTRRKTLADLRRVIGESAALAAWDWACAEVGADGDAPEHSHDELIAIAQKLASAGGLIGVVGSSLWVNLATEKALEPQPAPAAAPPTSPAPRIPVSGSTLEPAELERLKEIAALDLTSRETDAILANFAEQASHALEVPVSLVSIVLDDAQFFLASHGLRGWMEETRGTPVEWAFCRIAIQRKEVFVVEDATNHPLVQDNPLVTDHGIRCYLGAPLVTSRGNALGTLCVVGTEERKFTQEDQEFLTALAGRAVAYLERRAADRHERRGD